MFHGPREECVKALRNGHLLAISPGGLQEALFSDETYPLLWGRRQGFAHVAIDSKAVSASGGGGCMGGGGHQTWIRVIPCQLHTLLDHMIADFSEVWPR